jgi:hypothetical protein
MQGSDWSQALARQGLGGEMSIPHKLTAFSTAAAR